MSDYCIRCGHLRAGGEHCYVEDARKCEALRMHEAELATLRAKLAAVTAERDEARAAVEKAHESVDGLSKVPRGRPLWTRVETALLDVGDDAANYSRQAAKARRSARAWKALASVYRASMSLCSGPCHLFVRERRPARRTHGR